MPKEKKKYRDQKYRTEWEKETWAQNWLCQSSTVVGKAFCKVCKKLLVPGKSELQSHTKSASHIQNMKTVSQVAPMTSFVQTINSSIVKAKLNIVALIARNNLSFNLSDSLLATFHAILPD